MARQRMSAKNTRKIARETGLDVVAVLVRGGTNHRKDLCLRDGSIVCLCKDGTTFESEGRHSFTEQGEG